MPAVLVTVISLVQNNILNNTGTQDVGTIFVDEDKSDVGKKFADVLTKDGPFTLIFAKTRFIALWVLSMVFFLVKENTIS